MTVDLKTPEPPMEVLHPDSAARFGLIALVIGFGGFLLWATLAPLSEGVIASGSVVVDGKRKTIQHFEGGIVRSINVKEGDHVEEGFVLAELEQTQSQAQQELFLTRYYTSLAVLSRLDAERNERDTITFKDILLANTEDKRVAELMDIQNNLFEARRAQISGQVSLLNSRVEQLGRQVMGLGVELDAKNEEIGFIKEELTRTEKLHDQGLIGLPKLLAQKKGLSQANGAVGKIQSSIATAEMEIGKAKLEILQVQKDRQQEIVEKILETQEQSFEVQEQLASVNDVLDRTLIRAPQAGKVMALQITTIGGVVPAGQPLMEIIPDDRRLVVEARVRNLDIDNVLVGMPARTKFVALKSRSTPDLNGIVEDVSADVIIDEKTGESFYMAKITIPAEELSRITDDVIVPGMPVEVLIEAGARTALEYLTDPILDVVRRSMTED